MRRFYPFAFMLSMLLLPPAFAQQDTALPVSQAPDQAPNTQPAVDEPPVTVKMNADKRDKKDDSLAPPKLPEGKTSMMGGTVGKIDGIRNKMNVNIYGGGKWTVAFDERTHFFRDGKETTFENVKKGDRVYVDTMLDSDGHRIFARNIRVITHTGPADARGQIMGFGGNTIQMQDSLSSKPVMFHLAADTKIQRDGQPATIDDLLPGAIIAVRFRSDQPNRGIAQEIDLIGAPGQTFTFAGKVTHLDLSTGLLALENRVDNKTYDIAFDNRKSIPRNLTLGSEATVSAIFDGTRYKANTINVDQSK